MSRLVTVLIAVASLGFAPAPFLRPTPEAIKALAEADLKALQGEWATVEIHRGKKQLPLVVDSARWSGNNFDMRRDGQVLFPGLATLAPSRKAKWILLTRRGTKGKQSWEGIYRLEGERLTICLKYPRTPRCFDPADGVTRYVFRRKGPSPDRGGLLPRGR